MAERLTRSHPALDPELEVRRRSVPLFELTIAEARAADRAAVRAAATAPERVARILELAVPGPAGELPLRLYLPAPAESLPVLVFAHGGGWILGTIESADSVCRALANAGRCAVAAVGYRLAPEHRFPAAVEDCYATTRWFAEHGAELGLDGGRVAVAGASAGGNLAAAVTHLARARSGPPLAFQLLVYPPTDFGADTASMRESTDRRFFDRATAVWCWSHYLASEADGADPLASPLRARDFRGLPPALVITAELDPLRDEAERYAGKLAAAGVATELVRFDGMVHGFFSTGLDAAHEARALAASALRRAFSAAG